MASIPINDTDKAVALMLVLFQGKNEKLGFSWYHCKESMQKLTRQMKLSIKDPSEQSGNVGGRPSVTSRNN